LQSLDARTRKVHPSRFEFWWCEQLVFLTIAFDANYQVVSNGVLKKMLMLSLLLKYNMNKRWVPSADGCHWEIWDTIKSQNTELVGIVFGKEDAAKFEPTAILHKSLIFWKPNRSEVPLKIYKQIPVRDFLYANGKH
jgi:hypothetical protein